MNERHLKTAADAWAAALVAHEVCSSLERSSPSFLRDGTGPMRSPMSSGPDPSPTSAGSADWIRALRICRAVAPGYACLSTAATPATLGAEKLVPLATLMPPLFRAVLDRGSGGDTVAESRAAILVLAFYVNG